MTDEQFIEYALFKPYKTHSCGDDGHYDCWGLIVDYFRKVRGIELSLYEDGNIIDGFILEIESGKWKELERGVVFMSFIDDVPTHCGLVFDNNILHASGHENIGQVMLHKKRFVSRVFGDLKFYEFVD